jgi:hypothetical protein
MEIHRALWASRKQFEAEGFDKDTAYDIVQTVFKGLRKARDAYYDRWIVQDSEILNRDYIVQEERDACRGDAAAVLLPLIEHTQRLRVLEEQGSAILGQKVNQISRKVHHELYTLVQEWAIKEPA